VESEHAETAGSRSPRNPSRPRKPGEPREPREPTKTQKLGINTIKCVRTNRYKRPLGPSRRTISNRGIYNISKRSQIYSRNVS
jgi:hypothetical protein